MTAFPTITSLLNEVTMHQVKARFPTMRMLLFEGPEERLAHAAKKFPGIPKRELQVLLADDPTDGKYLLWMAKMRKASEPLDAIGSAVIEFHLVKQFLTQKDLNRYNSPDELLAAAHEHRGKMSRRQREKLAKKEGAELVYDSSYASVYHVKKEDASCILGAGTRWCISARRGNVFAEYSTKANIYFIFMHKLPKENLEHKIAVAVPRARRPGGHRIFSFEIIPDPNDIDDIYDSSNLMFSYDRVKQKINIQAVLDGIFHGNLGQALEIAVADDSHIGEDELAEILQNDNVPIRKAMGLDEESADVVTRDIKTAHKAYELAAEQDRLDEFATAALEQNDAAAVFICAFDIPRLSDELGSVILSKLPSTVKAFIRVAQGNLGSTERATTDLGIEAEFSAATLAAAHGTLGKEEGQQALTEMLDALEGQTSSFNGAIDSAVSMHFWGHMNRLDNDAAAFVPRIENTIWKFSTPEHLEKATAMVGELRSYLQHDLETAIIFMKYFQTGDEEEAIDAFEAGKNPSSDITNTPLWLILKGAIIDQDDQRIETALNATRLAPVSVIEVLAALCIAYKEPTALILQLAKHAVKVGHMVSSHYFDQFERTSKEMAGPLKQLFIKTMGEANNVDKRKLRNKINFANQMLERPPGPGWGPGAREKFEKDLRVAQAEWDSLYEAMAFPAMASFI